MSERINQDDDDDDDDDEKWKYRVLKFSLAILFLFLFINSGIIILYDTDFVSIKLVSLVVSYILLIFWFLKNWNFSFFFLIEY